MIKLKFSVSAIISAIVLCSGCLQPNSDKQTYSPVKTIVAWVKLNDLQTRGGAVMTIESGDQFDGIVLTTGGQWIAGSEENNRTKPNGSFDVETDTASLLQLAIVYESNKTTIYRNGNLYDEYITRNIDMIHGDESFIVFGRKSFEVREYISCAIEDARLYDYALSIKQIKSLLPNRNNPEISAPVAWWDFESDSIIEKQGNFPVHVLYEDIVPKVQNGRLVVKEESFLYANQPYKPSTPGWPKSPPDGWVTFHLAHPGEGGGPGDPNAAFFYNGRYHLHYIVVEGPQGYAYAHVSSKDMIHWEWHPTTLITATMGHTMYSGTGFLTNEGQPGIIYHGASAAGNFISLARDKDLEDWENPIPVIPKNIEGETAYMSYWDPDLWIRNDTYYSLSGHPSLNQAPTLSKSMDLKNWDFLGDFFHKDFPLDLGVDKHEDVSCANLFKLEDKWMLLSISHHLGCRYYLGDFKEEKFLPDLHALMNWKRPNWEEDHNGELVYFAPESLLTPDNRRVMWAWLMIENIEPSPIQSLPRELALHENGKLSIKPLNELKTLRYDLVSKSELISTVTEKIKLEVSGNALELFFRIKTPVPDNFSLVFKDSQSEEDLLRIEGGSRHSTMSINKIDPEFQLGASEDLTLSIFIDKRIVEVFMNDRQAAAVAIDTVPQGMIIECQTKDKPMLLKDFKVWKMRSIYNSAL